MQIVINLSEKDYKSLNRYINFNLEYEDGRILSAVKQGVVLPENHGRLIDADEAKNTMKDVMCGTGYQTQAMDVVGSDFYTPTILEATEGEK